MKETRHILGVKVNFGYTMKEAVEEVANLCQRNTQSHICTTNPEFILDAQKDTLFREIINSSDLSLPDGIGVSLSYIYLNKIDKLKNKKFFEFHALYEGLSLLKYFWNDKSNLHTVPGVWLMWELCKYASINNLKIGLVGGWPRDSFGKPLKGKQNLAKDLGMFLKEQFPTLNVIYSESNILHKEEYDSKNVNMINDAISDNKIDILFVAFGHPNQEKWIFRNKHLLNAKVFIGVGGSFETIYSRNSAKIRAYTDNGYEWLYRLFTNPWRVKRILKALFLFPVTVYIHSIVKS